MPDWWPVVVGWPSVVASIAVYAAAFLASRPWLAVVGAALSAPFCLFVSGYPKVGLLGLTALVSNCGAAWALTKDPPRNKRKQCRKHWTFPWSLIVKAGEVSRKGPSRWWIQNGWEARRTTVFNRKVRAEKDKGIRKEYDLMKAHLNERAIFTGEWVYAIVPRTLI